MAKVISDEILKLKIVVNGDEAQKRVLDLEQSNKKLADSIAIVKKEQAKLSAQRKTENAELKSIQLAITEVTAQMNARRGASKKLESTLLSLQKQEADLNLKTRKTTEAFNKNKNEIVALTSKIAQNKSQIDAEIKSMDILSLTSQQLTKRIKDLKYSMSVMNPNLPEYAKTKAELDALNARMTTLRTGANASALSIQNLAGKFNHYSGIVTGALAAMAGVALSIKGTIDLNNKLAEAQTTVAKTTGMNNEEVKELMRTYSDFDTRTSKMDLLKISEVGGRLGVPKEEIAEFTKEVDKMYVALGDSFEGGVEQVANQMGKIKNLFRETKDLDIATAFNQIGSSLNELGANGAASESNIADFTLRIGALPDNLKPSIAETLALGAAFEESGIDAERSGTAYSSFVRMAAKESGKFAEVMNLTKKEVDDLINKDPMQFFLKFAEGAKGLDTVEMAKMLEYLKLNDQYVISILGAASENTDRFRKTINLSNESLKEATSLTEEFNKVNNNAAAIYDKVRKSIIGAFTSETVAKSLNWLIESFGKMIGAVEDADGKWRAIGQTFMFVVKLLTIVTVGVISFNTAVALSNLTLATAKERLLAYTVIQKLNNALNSAGAIVQNLVTASVARAQLAYALLTRNTTLQTAAQAKMNAVALANPWGVIIALVAAAAAAYVMFAKRTDEVAAKQKVLNDVRADAAQRVAEEKAALDTLVATARNENLSKQQRLDAIKRLNAISPEYLGNLTLENIKTAEGTKLIQAYVKALDQKAMAEAIQSKKVDLMKKMVEERTKGLEEYDDWTGVAGRKAGNWLNNTFRPGPKLKSTIDFAEWDKLSPKQQAAEYDKYMPTIQSAINERAKAINKLGTEIKEVNKLQTQFLGQNPNTIVGGGGSSTYNTNLGGSAAPSVNPTRRNNNANNADNKWEREKEAMLRNGESAKELAIQLEIDRQNAIADLEKDWYPREWMQIKADGLAAVTDLEKKLITDAEFAKLDIIISKTKGAERAKFEAIREQWFENNRAIEDLKLKAEEITLLKLQALNEKLFKENLKKEQEQLQEKIQANQNALTQALAENGTVEQIKTFLASLGYSEEALNQIRTWNEGKAAIEKYYQQQSLDEQIRFLRTKVEILKALMVVDPSNITPEQLAILQNYTLEINKLLAAKNNLANGDQAAGPNFSSLSQFGAGNTDIFGLNPEQWEAMFTNTDDLATNINKIGAALQVAQNMFAQYSAFVQANEQKMLQKMEAASDRKQRKLKKELNEGYINQETYKKLTIANEMELEKKKAELALKAAKRERAMNIASAISGTAIAVVGALGNKPWTPFNMVLAGLVGAMGAVQLATIMSQPLPEVTGAEDGLYPVMRSQDKKVFNSRRRNLSSGMYNEPTLLVGEAGKNYPEMVIDGKTMKRLKPSTVQQLNSEVAQARGFEDGLYKENTTSGSNDEIMLQMMGLIRTNIDVLNEIRETGITAVIGKTARNGKEVDEMRQEYLDLKNKNKH